ncbi:hypothetical protein Salat_1440100 [Sesamum alatum]|uniref:Uncharacterized protein n=1 Tax=Sesamum alatum TaxID=300844 RepID=A0AAE1YAL1_9LAMI|nr:hypothetical protein Salat_1440100 [Sesamum alatum]
MKAINSEAMPVQGVASVDLMVGTWQGKCSLRVVTLDNFDLILGMDFLLLAKAMVVESDLLDQIRFEEKFDEYWVAKEGDALPTRMSGSSGGDGFTNDGNQTGGQHTSAGWPVCYAGSRTEVKIVAETLMEVVHTLAPFQIPSTEATRVEPLEDLPKAIIDQVLAELNTDDAPAGLPVELPADKEIFNQENFPGIDNVGEDVPPSKS